MATSLYQVTPASGSESVDLATAKERTTGAAFSGFNAGAGVWAIGLRCSSCQNPAPVLLSVLEPTP
jgi:hypothetical protein